MFGRSKCVFRYIHLGALTPRYILIYSKYWYILIWILEYFLYFKNFKDFVLLTSWKALSLNWHIFTKTGIASFAPKEKGTYTASICRSDEKPVKGSPFSIKVGDNEIAHAAKVHLTGQTTSAQANTDNFFTIDTTGAG